MNLSVLVHTFNKYERYWDGYLNGFHKHFNYEGPCYLGTDVPEHGVHDYGRFKLLYSGDNEWSDRLINLLGQIQTEWVIYFQEDMWPTAAPPNIAELLSFMQQNDVWRLQISPVVQFYSLVGSKIPLYFHWKSKYLVSHQPSIWKKDFLLSCLEKNENPWENEYRGTLRLNKESISKKIAIFPCDWYSHESVKSKK